MRNNGESLFWRNKNIYSGAGNICQKAISVQPCTRPRTKENSSETKLRRLALDGQLVKNLRSLASKFELDPSERKSSQVHASRGQTEAITVSTCDNLRLRLARALRRKKETKKLTVVWFFFFLSLFFFV